MNKPELLAPAGSMESLIAALRCGADAVYAGAKQFSARANAENFDAAGLKEAAARCHLQGAKLYLAVNTLLWDSEFSALDALAAVMAEAGIDGCIIQDLGVAAYLSKRLPTLRLHASTQLTIHTPAGVFFAKQAGFCRAVAARELSQQQLAAVCAAGREAGVEIEAFVHGAHCMSVSGQCFLSAAMGGRSANRGCCAQPCRLSFTAAGCKETCGLSLKDLSLVSHLQEMAEMGVSSLKIEGRMKRPEYVAAAVTACRATLDGATPDLHTLKAVFSRSGFTDGYYTGLRRDMFGTRQKTDVLAAQDVLNPLRESYRKERAITDLNAHFTLHAGMPAVLQVSDSEGRSCMVSGDVPQPARTRPTDVEQLKRQFEKLGDTIYRCGMVTADLEEGLMLPASSLNALRRAATDKMDETRIAANQHHHQLQNAPSQPAYPQHDGLQYRLQIRQLRQLDALGDMASRMDALLLPLSLAEDYLAGAQPFPLSRCILVPPRFTVDEVHLRGMLETAKSRGFTRLSCQHAGDLALGKAMGFQLHGGYGLHAANAYAADWLLAYGVTDLLTTPEAGVLSGLGSFVYGRIPLMLTRNCPIQNQTGCKGCRHTLIDRKGTAVYTDCTRTIEKPDYAELFNAAPIWLADRPQAYQAAAYGLLFMTDESPERVRAIVAAYCDGMPCPPPQPYTRGLKVAEHS